MKFCQLQALLDQYEIENLMYLVLSIVNFRRPTRKIRSYMLRAC